MHKTIDQSPHVVNPIITERPDVVELTPNGIKFTRSYRVDKMRGGGKRGKVQGFSLASARRLRETLFKCDFRPAGMGVLGICLTLPKEAKVGDGEAVWGYMRMNAKTLYPGLVSLVWRKEVQRNGREHYHAVMWSRNPNPLPLAVSLVRTWCKRVAAKCDNPDEVERKMRWTHFRGHDDFLDLDIGEVVAKAVKAFTVIDSQGQGVRYLVDHTSKHKRHQAETTGRPWGVWGRDRLPLIPPGSSISARMSKREGVELARILRRLSRYWVKAPCAFGWKWCRGRRFLRGANILADAMARDAARRWLELRGIIPTATPPPPRPRRPVQPPLPLIGQELGEFAEGVWSDWDKGRPVP